MQHSRVIRLFAPAASAALLLLAACSDDSSSSKVASLGTTATDDSVTATATPADSQEALLAYASCMRDNGVDMEDPTFDADGNMTGGGFGPDSGIDPRSDEFQTAQEACGDLIEGVDIGGGPGGGLDRDAIQTAMNDYTACLRDQGLDVDDITMGQPGDGGPGGQGGTPPDGSTPTDGSVPPGGFDGGPNGTPPDGAAPGAPGGDGFDPTARLIEQLGLDSTDATVSAAMESCQSIMDNAFTPTTEA
jgi:hypothetical protein